MNTNGSTQPYPDAAERLARIFNEQRPLPAYEQVKELAALQIDMMQASHQATAVQQHLLEQALGDAVQALGTRTQKGLEGIERQVHHQSHGATQRLEHMQESIEAVAKRLDTLTQAWQREQRQQRHMLIVCGVAAVLSMLVSLGVLAWHWPLSQQASRIEGGIAYILRQQQQALEQPAQPPRKGK